MLLAEGTYDTTFFHQWCKLFDLIREVAVRSALARQNLLEELESTGVLGFPKPEHFVSQDRMIAVGFDYARSAWARRAFRIAAALPETPDQLTTAAVPLLAIRHRRGFFLT